MTSQHHNQITLEVKIVDKSMMVSALLIFIGLLAHGILTGPVRPTSLDGMYIKHGLEAVARSIDRLASNLDKK